MLNPLKVPAILWRERRTLLHEEKRSLITVSLIVLISEVLIFFVL